MSFGIVVLNTGFLLGLIGFALWAPADGTRQACLAGWLICAVIEAVLLRRRFRVLRADQPAVSFAIVLAGGFVVKLVALAGISLLAHFATLFPPMPFMLAFLGALVWGETLSLILLNLHLSRRDGARQTSEDT